MIDTKKIAIMHDWLLVYAGAERVLEQFLKVYPQADLFAMVEFLPEELRWFIQNKPVKTSFIQKLPFAKSHYRQYLPLMPLAIEQVDVSRYDVVLSSHYAVIKGMLTGPNQTHICYIHSPMRYAWDLHHQYLEEANLTRGIKSWLARSMLHYMRLWDYRTANGVDHFIANSQFIAKRVKKIYGRDASVIYPPVDTSAFAFQENKDDFYLTASRMVPYKKMDLIVEAFSDYLPDKRLVVIGHGPEWDKIKQKAGPNVELLGYQPHSELVSHMQRAKAFVFAAEEDFGITPVEAQACGTPVISFGRGGVLESVRGPAHEQPTGLFFDAQTVESLVNAIYAFESQQDRISPHACHLNAQRFSPDRFRMEIEAAVSGFVNH